jgi:hypothetical protein
LVTQIKNKQISGEEKMNKLLLTIAMVLVANSAKADGFLCETMDGALKVKAFNEVQPEEGTRNPAIMILSDANVQAGRKTIATFESSQTLGGSSVHYVAKVDLRYNNSNTKGEYLLGTRLGELKKIVLDVDFTYAQPVRRGQEVEGLITATKRNGEVIEQEVVCERYLKN